VQVVIDVKSRTVTIADDGHGMTRRQINDRYLNVGYQRRLSSETSVTPKFNRRVMGRKGIGKLSLFSVAEEVEVHTARDGQVNSFRMTVVGIREAVTNNPSKPEYLPEEIAVSPEFSGVGTLIVLKKLKKGLANTSSGLRKRLARRFTVLDPAQNFELFIGSEMVTLADRDYYGKIQYLWAYGSPAEQNELKALCANAESLQPRGPQTISVAPEASLDRQGEEANEELPAPDEPLPSFQVTGWIGTAKEAGSLRDTETRESLNKIALVVRGKVAHENLLEDFNENGIYASYLIGEVVADYLDRDEGDDIATSSRQRIIEGDPRFTALQTWLQSEVTRIGTAWTALRNAEGTRVAFDNPYIKAWFKSLGPDAKKKAERLFGKINQLTTDDEEAREQLFAQSVLAFETLRYKDSLDALDALDPAEVVVASKLFTDVSDIQAAMYHKIVTQRLEVIDKFEEFVDSNALENLLQEHLFDNLWLLDPGWERATDRTMEERIGKSFAKISEKLTDEERRSRIDIRYKKTGGAHVIVELKRANVKLSEPVLLTQVNKYRNAVTAHLDNIESTDGLQTVVVVGRDLEEWNTLQGRNESIRSLAQRGIRVVQYEKLLADARAGYREYLDGQTDLGRIQTLLKAIANEAGGEEEDRTVLDAEDEKVLDDLAPGGEPSLTGSPGTA